MAYIVRVYSFSDSGISLANAICNIQAKIFRCEKLVFEKCNNSKISKEDFESSSAHVFVGAAGIAVRKIAPFISDKKKDPAVIVIDEKGQFVIPVLSGHTGGANELSRLIADEIYAKAVLTTATDVNGYKAIDTIVAKHRLAMSPVDAARTVNNMLLHGEKIKVYVDKDIDVIEDESGVYEISDLESCDVAVANIKKYILGVGCRKQIDSKVFEDTLNMILSEYGIRHIDIDRISSIDLKQKEMAIVDFSEKYEVMFETYSTDELNSVSGIFDESDFVKEITGVSNVSERACVYAADMIGRGDFLLKRKAENGITVSIYKIIKRIDLNGKS